MPDDPAPFLVASGQISRDIGNGKHGDIKGVTEPDEPGGLIRCINVQASGQEIGLVGDDADGMSAQPCKTDHHIFGKILMGLEILPVIHDGNDDVLDIIGPVGIIRDKGIQGGVHAVFIILGLNIGRIFHIIGRQVG